VRETATKFGVTPRLTIVSSGVHFLLKFEERKENDIFAALNKEEGAALGERFVLIPSS